MARPRKPDDPDLRRVCPCDRCGLGYPLVVNWGPEDQICGYCYQQAKRTRGTCDCGHIGVLPGRVDGRPACRACAQITLNIDCVRCGAEDEIYRAGLCWPCALSETVDGLLTNPDTGTIAERLIPLAEALKSMKRANSGLTWIRQRHVTDFLEQLASLPELTHEAIDALPRSRTRDYVRGLLVEHGGLPRRDELLVRYQAWADTALERLTEDTNRAVIDRYVRWHHLRRMNQMDPVPHGTFLRSKQTVTVAINFLNWLGERDIALADVDQGEVDAWIAGGPTTRLLIDRFLGWAMDTKNAPQGLTVPRHRRGNSTKLSATGQVAALDRIVDGDTLTTRDKAAAILVLVFGQQIQDIAALTWDDITVTEDLTTIALGSSPIALPTPLDGPWRELLANPGHDQTAAHPRSNWVFRGHSPGRHIDPMHLRLRLRDHLVSARAARLGTLHELSKTAPAAIIADVLGYHPSTIERHAVDAAGTYAEYIAAVREHGQR